MVDYNFRIDIAHSIGHGGQADVFLVRRDDTGSFVAAKFLREWWDPLQRGAFIREAQRQIRAAGPRVVPILGWNLQAAQPFIVVPYMSGGTLADEITRVVQGGCVWTPEG